jgi:tetratricopeptide (TPR) repeat protein
MQNIKIKMLKFFAKIKYRLNPALCKFFTLNGKSTTDNFDYICNVSKNDRYLFIYHYKLGTDELKNKNISNAINHFLKAHDLAPDAFILNMHLTAAYFEVKDYDNALKYLSIALELVRMVLFY